MGCFFNLHRKTKIKRGGDSVKELNRSNKADRKPTNRGIEALETLPTPRSIPELYKEKEHTLRVFTFEELKIATNGFSRLLRIGEGGFGSVYRGQIRLEGDQGEEIIVAIKRLKSNSSQGHKQWLAEVQFLGVVSHPNLVKLLGYCSEDGERGIQRLLVYEFMSNGSLEDHLFSRSRILLTWKTRLQIILGAAQGLAYLHEGLEVQVIYRDFKSSNVLLDEEFSPKLSDFGLAREGPTGDHTHVSTAVVGTYGYAAPEYVVTGHLTMQSDIWSFGVVLYEILTGRRTLERNRPTGEQKLMDKCVITGSGETSYVHLERPWGPFARVVFAYTHMDVSHGAIQFTVYEELRKVIANSRSKGTRVDAQSSGELLNSGDYAVLGGTSKIAAMLLTYPFQVIRARLLQFRKRNVKPLLHLVPVSNINNCLKKHFRDL